RPDPEVVITYEGVQPADLGPLHAYTLTTFNGASWEHGESEQWDAADGDCLWPGAVGAVSKDSASITIRSRPQERLLVPGQPPRGSVANRSSGTLPTAISCGRELSTRSRRTRPPSPSEICSRTGSWCPVSRGGCRPSNRSFTPPRPMRSDCRTRSPGGSVTGW